MVEDSSMVQLGLEREVQRKNEQLVSDGDRFVGLEDSTSLPFAFRLLRMIRVVEQYIEIVVPMVRQLRSSHFLRIVPLGFYGVRKLVSFNRFVGMSPQCGASH